MLRHYNTVEGAVSHAQVKWIRNQFFVSAEKAVLRARAGDHVN